VKPNRLRFRVFSKYGCDWNEDCTAVVKRGIMYPLSGAAPEHVCSDEYDLMQSTGYADKNGKEIFESDIVSRSDSEEHAEMGRDYSVVRFVFGMFSIDDCDNLNTFTPLAVDLDDYRIEVIGNIYENKELL